MVSPVLSIYNLAGARIYGGRTGLCIHCIQLFPSPKCWEGKAVHRDKGKGNISLCLSSPSLVFPRPGYWHQVWCVHSKDIGCGPTIFLDWTHFAFTIALPHPSLLVDISSPFPLTSLPVWPWWPTEKQSLWNEQNWGIWVMVLILSSLEEQVEGIIPVSRGGGWAEQLHSDKGDR